MPIAYLIDKANGYVFTKACGRVTIEDVHAHFAAVRRERVQAFKELIDARAVTPPFPATGDIWQAALSVRRGPYEERFGPRAVVVKDDTLFGIARMFATFVGDLIPTNVFRHEAAAEEWLACWLPGSQA